VSLDVTVEEFMKRVDTGKNYDLMARMDIQQPGTVGHEINIRSIVYMQEAAAVNSSKFTAMFPLIFTC
jgi:hypothetical protein